MVALVATVMMTATSRSGSGNQHSATSQPSPSSARDAKLTEVIPKSMLQASVPGAIVGVWKDDGASAPFVHAFGVRNTATGEPMSTDMYTRIGSLTKSFVVTALLQLVDQKKLGLDDPIGKYVADVPNGDAITLRELAAMRSGLYSYTDVVIPALPSQPQRQWTPQELLAVSFSHPPLFPPGTEFDYSNTNTVLLGLAIEKASGQSLQSYLEDHITRPENLTHTVFVTDSAFPSPHTQGYTKLPDGTIVNTTDWNMSWGWGAGNLASTLDDTHTWIRDAATGKLVSPASQREREQFQLAPSEGTGSLYGLGLENQNGWIGHNGNTPGFQTYAYYLPPEDTTMVVMVNSSIDLVGVWNLVSDIVKVVSPAHPWPAPPAAETVAPR
jgi:D-alanyl-D-alanine carboxypeptidase